MYHEGTDYIPFTRSHGNFTHIEKFQTLEDNPDLYRPKLSPHNQIRLDFLLKTLNKKEFIQRRCFKTCFKLEDKSFAELCLQKKCNSTFDNAALALGLKR